MATIKEISLNGIWKNNPALVQLLGLCPLLAVTGSVVNAIGLGLATMLVLVGSNIAVSMIRHAVSDAVRLPAFVMIIASFTTATELLMQAFTYELYQILGIFIPLIVTNCAILGRADAFASKNSIVDSALDGFMMSLGFFIALFLIGLIRELIGTGHIFSNMNLLFGENAQHVEINVFGEHYRGFLIAILPPGAFLVAGLLIALKNILDTHIEERRTDKQHIVTGSKRVRTTGNIN